MDTRHIRRILMTLLMLAMLTLPALPAFAEEIKASGQLELYIDGKLPPSPKLITSKASETVQDVLTKGLKAQKSKIDIKKFNLSPNEFQVVYQDLMNNSPDLFFVGNSYSYWSDGSNVTALEPTYRYSGTDLQNRIAAYEKSVNEIVEDAKKADTLIGRMLRANEYFCTHFEYDKGYQIYSADLLFSQKKGVCQAYMLGYKAVLDRLGVTSIAVPSNPLNHIWNLVKLDGSWYHIDPTWNDPLVNNADVPLGAFHHNFLRSDAGMRATDHTTWDPIPYSATSTKYDDAFWIDNSTPLTVLGSTVYYTTFDQNSWKATVRSHDFGTGASSSLYSYSPTFYNSWGLPCCANDYRVYFAIGHEVYSVDKNGEKLRLEYTLDKTNRKVYRMTMEGSLLTMFISTSDPATGDVITVDLTIPFTIDLPDGIAMTPGETLAMPMTFTPEPKDPPILAHASSRPEIVSVDANGVLTAIAPGTATVMTAYSEDYYDTTTVTVCCENTICLPSAVKEISDEAFTGVGAEYVEIPETATTIGHGAFSQSDALLFINLPDSLTSIAEDAFDGSDNVTVLCSDGCFAHDYTHSCGVAHIVLKPEITLTPASVLGGY